MPSPINTNPAGLSRRALMRSSSLGAVGFAAGVMVTGKPTRADPPRYNADAMAAQISGKLFADDGLVRPVPDEPIVSELARGLDRTLVLGGGGEYYVAWYCGFLRGLYEQKVDLNIAEMVVGTSAGAYAGSTLTSGHFKHLLSVFDFFGQFPGLFAKLAPVTSPNLSQKRAQEINFSVKDGSPPSIRAIGHAALAADNRLNGDGVDRLAWLLTGDSRTAWPVARMYTTANDCYTGERLIIDQTVARKNDIPLAHATAASSSLPGVIGPTLLGQRYCMDGGISRVWAHQEDRMAIHIRRRELIVAFGGAAVWPIAAHAQHAANMPTIPDCLAVPNGSGYGSCMPDGLITVRSAFDPAETKARLLAVLKDKGVTVFADIPHAKGAAQAGLVLAYSDLVIFGKPDAGTPLMQAAPTAGIDLPMKALVWQDADGVAWLSYNDARWIAARHGIGGAPAAEALATALAAFAKHTTER